VRILLIYLSGVSISVERSFIPASSEFVGPLKDDNFWFWSRDGVHACMLRSRNSATSFFSGEEPRLILTVSFRSLKSIQTAVPVRKSRDIDPTPGSLCALSIRNELFLFRPEPETPALMKARDR
jgi:hypothetical protein